MNLTMQQAVASGTAIDLSQCVRNTDGDYLMPPGMFREGVDYCDSVTEEWIYSIGERAGLVLASTNSKFYGHPDWECRWLR